jgi:lipopolysaccharide export system permease protein
LRTLDRYVAREFLRLFTLFALAAPLLFVLGHWTDSLDTFTERGLPLGQVALGYLYMLPQFILWSFPIASLIATVFTVSAMTRHSEMAAAKAGGISFHRVTLVLPVLGIVLTLTGLFLTEIVPLGIRRSAELHGEKSGFQSARTDFVYRGEDGNVYGIRRIDLASGRIYGITMESEGDRAERPTLHAYAREAAWDSAAADRSTASSACSPATGPEQLFDFERLSPDPPRRDARAADGEPKDPEEMRYAEMDRFIQALERSAASPSSSCSAARRRSPFRSPLSSSFRRAAARRQRRPSGPAYGIGVSLGITIVYLMMFRLAQAVGATGAIRPASPPGSQRALHAGAGGLMLRVKS